MPNSHVIATEGTLSQVYHVSGYVVDVEGKLYEVKRAFENVAASDTDEEIVAAVSGKKIRVLAVVAVAGGTATNLTFNSASAAISPLLANGTNGGEVLPYNPHGWFQTVAGEALTVTTGAGSTTGILILYIEI
jgi:hypothetical protein